MTQSAHTHPSFRHNGPRSRARRKREHLRHIHPMTRERQIALVEEARAARRTEQGISELQEPKAAAAHQVHAADTVDPDFRHQMLGLLPSLRAFAISLTNDSDKADDLVQETILRAWGHRNDFERGTNLSAWLFTILRNSFYTEYRRHKHDVEDPDGTYVGRLKAEPEQVYGLELYDLRRALAQLCPEHREALILIGAEQMSYDEAAAICGVPVGTIKSRVNRARVRLALLLGIEDQAEIGPDQTMKAAMQEPS
jgi:RNA polymerase sigma-70 factor (ECF subfamily)